MTMTVGPNDTAIAAPVFLPFSPEFAADPYPHYAAIVRDNPIHFAESIGAWVLAGHRVAAQGLRDLRFESRPGKFADPLAGRALQSPSTRILTGMVGYVDPPLHTRMRALIREAMNPYVGPALRETIERNVEAAVECVALQGEFDLVSDLTLPLACDIISRVLGVPASDAQELRAATRSMARIFDPLPTTAVRQEIDQAVSRFRDYFLGLIGLRRRAPGDDMISRLIRGVRPELRLSDNDIVSNCALIYMSGQESPGNLIASSMLALSQFPEQWEVLHQHADELPLAVEELIRFSSPAQFSARTAATDCEYADRKIARGEVVFMLIAAANRDPARFHEPDRVDLRRVDNPHLAFGGGLHHCMGSEISRMQLESFLRSLVRRRLRVVVPNQQLLWKPYLAMRGLTHLQVRLESYAP